MEGKLLNDITTEELLEKFGKGSHKPGSGSAAACQGMLSAKLLVTVISLTKQKQTNNSPELLSLIDMENEIQDEIFSNLTTLFHEDSIQFDKTIKSRRKRDSEENVYKKRKYAKEALDDLKVAVDIPLTIAELNIRLAKIAEFVFDHGFQSARGDSHVALSGAVAGLSGCISIVNLNLLSFKINDVNWVGNKMIELKRLKGIYKNLIKNVDSKVEILEKEVEQNLLLYTEVNQLLNSIRKKKKVLSSDIENFSSQFLKIIWNHRNTIWKKNPPTEYIEILNCAKIFKKVMDYDFHDDIIFSKPEDKDIAGIIDNNQKLVLISNDYKAPIKRFTAAHELGHSILHPDDIVLHRDLPRDGSRIESKLDLKEYQANKFAASFLMPRRLVKQIFKELFGVDKFVLNNKSAFHLSGGKKNYLQLKEQYKDLNSLAYKLASTEFYAQKPIKSISEIFGVSNGAMSIRLIELNLVEI